MPYFINSPLAVSRMVHAESNIEFARAYFVPLALGDPITPELLSLTPDPLCITPPTRGKMPEIFGASVSWIVAKSFKDLLEEMEPNIHTFIPIKLDIRKSGTILNDYYVLCIGQAIDAIDRDQTKFADREKTMLRHADGATVLKQQMIEGRHLWRGGRGKMGGGGDQFWSKNFCSDTLRNQIKKKDIDGWHFIRCGLI